ncbi:hypothetical protein [Cupriavidus plantarum]|uniref:hypothetical protein n=1 Tax=Cupriavidus plantarum TaxID=942865 RepID=UPI000EACE67B|nr:hypothetical protein [Cupriavidus plantarum]
MSAESAKIAEPELSLAALKHFLETSPLYVKKFFSVNDPTFGDAHVREVDDHCSTCNQIRPFHSTQSAYSLSDRIIDAQRWLEFKCVSCKTDTREYLVKLTGTRTTLTVEKFGEWPRQRLKSDKVLERFFEDDLDNYRKAAACIAHSYGAGAFVYFRRIVESHVVQLLDLVQAEATATGADSDALAAIGALRKESPMSDKIEIANRALPPHLKPDGLNPLGRIYGVLSDGVHTLSDAECLAKANILANCMTFLLGELSERKRKRDDFKKSVAGL